MSFEIRSGGALFELRVDDARVLLRATCVRRAAGQVHQALALLETVLQSAGSNLRNVVQVTMLIQDPAEYAECNAASVPHFPHGLPARHTARFGVPTEAKVAFACIAQAAPGP